MPPSTRRRAQAHTPSPPPGVRSDSSSPAFPSETLSHTEDEHEELPSGADDLSPGSGEEEDGDVDVDAEDEEEAEEDGEELEDEEDEEEEEDEDEEHGLASAVIPPNFREISTLASWTVSSSKPGCSVPQLRHPSPSLFWQSDGPQPHYLNIHFFKLVRIVGLRLYLDFEQDESYTPTRIVLLAGSGMNDLVEWGEMRLESPRGWVWADFSGVEDVDDDEDDEGDGDADGGQVSFAMGSGFTPVPNAGTADAQDTAQDDTSDFENTAPRMPPPRPAQASAAATPSPAHDDTSILEAHHRAQAQARTRTRTRPHHHQHQHQHQHQHLETPTNQPQPQAPPPSLPRPQPRHPFTPLAAPSASALAPRAARSPRKPKMPVLRCHLVQIKILENHQNGKDTHLRGLQIFASEGDREGRGDGGGGERVGNGARRESGAAAAAAGGRGRGRERARQREGRGFRVSEWMREPVIR